MSRNDEADPALTKRLGYLLKHAQLRMFDLSTKALAPFDINGRELAVLVALAGHEPASQLQAAQRLGIDRTTMVGLLDTLEDKGLLSRHPHAEDRRRNVVELTETGQDTLRRANAANAAAEHEFLAPLSARAADQLVAALRAVVNQPTD